MVQYWRPYLEETRHRVDGLEKRDFPKVEVLVSGYWM